LEWFTVLTFCHHISIGRKNVQVVSGFVIYWPPWSGSGSSNQDYDSFEPDLEPKEMLP
jgi:hypothetical protein